jgi:hypothetical protein
MVCSICKQKGHNKRSCKKVFNPDNELKINIKPILIQIELMTDTKEVQKHGIDWQNEILVKVYGIPIEQLKLFKYTAKYDLPANLNSIDHCNVSIKTSCNENSVCMADCLRLFDSVNSNAILHMVVIIYIQDDDTNTKNISKIIEIDLTNSRNELFGTLSRSQLEELDKEVKTVPQKRKPTEEEHTKMYSLKNSLQLLSGAIHLDIKCNSAQSRLQCSFNHFLEFMEKNPHRILSKSDTNTFRGKEITKQIVSSRRILNKKIKI